MSDELMISSDNDSKEGIKKISLGMHVDLLMVCDSGIEPLSFDIVPDQFADFDHGLLSIESPIAKTILDHFENETIPFQMGDIHAIYIKEITSATSLPSHENAAKRENIIKNAVAESERTNAIIFASSFSGKWGDYDPGNIKEDW
jgi:hypothetical protein